MKSQPMGMGSLEEYESVSQEKAFFQEVQSRHKSPVRPVICQRCVEIKKSSSYVSEVSSKLQEEQSEVFIKDVLAQMQRRCLVIYVVDVMNLS